MIYLIGQLGPWLLLTAAFAALVGWAWAAERDRPTRRASEYEREKLLRDLSRVFAGERQGDPLAAERETETAHRLLAVRDGRIAELERLLAAARDRADEAAGRVAELERTAASAEQSDEIDRLRALVAQHESARAREVEVVAEQVSNAEALNAWRLRYFEQRVKYLEALPRQPEPETLLMHWQAREAGARAAYLEGELRSASVDAPSGDAPAFAANADIDALLRWRTLYLERRARHARAQAATYALTQERLDESERWKWRSRYLEARVRHLEQTRTLITPTAVAATIEAPAAKAPTTLARRVKPPLLSGPRNGAPDDLTLIEGVSQLQRTTLYSLGVFHLDQIASWTTENVAWLDQYFRLNGRIDAEEWVEQAADLVRNGVVARRIQHEDA